MDIFRSPWRLRRLRETSPVGFAEHSEELT